MNSVAIAPAYIHSSVKRRKNTWYSIASGNWTDPNIWMSNEWKRWSYPGINIPTPIFPQIGDDVFINHIVACNTTAVVNNLYISGTLTSATNSITLTVNGDLQCTGSISFTSSINLKLFGVNNYIVSFTSGASSTVTYTRAGDQYVLGLTYRNLVTQNNLGIKYVQSGVDALGVFTTSANTTLAADTVLSGSLTLTNKVTVQLSTFNLTVTGTSRIGTSNANGAVLAKSGAGNVLFIGLLDLATNYGGFLDFSGGNPTVELRGGISTLFASSTIKSGTGQWKFTTNNQSISGANNAGFFTIDAPVLISGAITVTLTSFTTITNITNFAQYENNGVTFTNSIDGDNTLSKFVNASQMFLTYAAAVPMATLGTFDITTNVNTLGYFMTGAYTLPYTTYSTLHVKNSTKTLSGNTTVAKLIIGPSVLECSIFNLTNNGTTNIGTGNSQTATISKTGAGSILFTGQVYTSVGAINVFNLTGNPNVEFRGGIVILSATIATTGTGTWTFSTNNQSIQSDSFTSITWSMACNILVSGAITLGFDGTTNAINSITITGTIDGNNAASIFENKLAAVLNYQNAVKPMVTGVLQANTSANTWLYNAAGAQDISGGTYRTLTLAGSGNKVLQGNVVVATLYTLTAPATLALNGYTRT